MGTALRRSASYVPSASEETLQWITSALHRRPRGFLTDIDGTLSPIAPTPDQARLYRGIRPLLRRCLDEFEVVAAISGRPALDARRLVGIAHMTYVGNHGLEQLAPQARIPAIGEEARGQQSAIADTLQEARRQLGSRFDHLLFENKGVTASIHYRMTHDPDAARLAIRSAVEPLARQHGLRIADGRMVVEIRPSIGLDKGTSVQVLTQTWNLQSAIYLGDDTTDIDALRALRQLRLEGVCDGIGVAVLHAEAPADLARYADVTLASIDEVPRFLRWMLATLH